MNSFLRLPLLATALLGLATSPARAQTAAYVETASLSILWNFTITGVSGTTIGLVPVIPGSAGATDPDKLRPVDRITTDIGSLIVYPTANGDQAFFTKHLLRNTTERYAEEYKALAEELEQALGAVEEKLVKAEAAADLIKNGPAGIIAQTSAYNSNATRLDALARLLEATTDEAKRDELLQEQTELNNEQPLLADKIADLNIELGIYETLIAEYKVTIAQQNSEYAPRLATLQNDIAYLNREATGRWELTSVREPQSTVAGATSTPFKIFLTRIEPSRGRSPTRTFDTGLRIVPLYSAGSSVETLSGGLVTKATGSYTTHFSLEFASFFATDPLSGLDAEERAAAVSGVDFNTAGDAWSVGGTGYMTYRLRSTPAPVVAVLPTAAKITGHGSWAHIIVSTDSAGGFSGIAPLSIKMGDIKYQDRHLFPHMNVIAD